MNDTLFKVFVLFQRREGGVIGGFNTKLLHTGHVWYDSKRNLIGKEYFVIINIATIWKEAIERKVDIIQKKMLTNRHFYGVCETLLDLASEILTLPANKRYME